MTRPAGRLPGAPGAPGGRPPRAPERRSPQADVLLLQRAIGNRGMASLAGPARLSRQPKGTPMPVSGGKSAGKAPTPDDALTDKERAALQMGASSRVIEAFVAFSLACQAHLNAFKAEAKSDAEMASVLIDIFFGMAAPVFAGRMLTSGGLTKKLAEKVTGAFSTTRTAEHAKKAKAAADAAAAARRAAESVAQTKAAAEAAKSAAKKALEDEVNQSLKKLPSTAGLTRRMESEARKAAARYQAAVKSATKAEAQAEAAAAAYANTLPAKLLSEQDFLKEGFKGVGKIATGALKLNATRLFGEDDVDEFARDLHTQFHAGIQALTDKIASGTLTDKELIATWLAYDVEFTNADAYVKELEHWFAGFKRYVRPIGSKFERGGPVFRSTKTYAAWVTLQTGERRLAIVEHFMGGGMGPVIEDTKILEWVPPEMEPFVLARAAREHGGIGSWDLRTGKRVVPSKPRPAAPSPRKGPPVIYPL